MEQSTQPSPSFLERMAHRPVLAGNHSARFQAALKQSPTLFKVLGGLRQTHKKRLVTPDTEVVVEGIARAGNHFAAFALEYAQGRPVDMAHHFHAPAQLLLAHRYGVPAIALIRDPIDQALSRMVFLDWMTPGTALEIYRRFYAPLRKIGHDLVVADFGQVTSDMGAVLDRVNQRYGTSFERFDHTEEHEREVFRLIREEHHLHMAAAPEKNPLPSEAKNARKTELREEMLEPRWAQQLAVARGLYEEFCELAHRDD